MIFMKKFRDLGLFIFLISTTATPSFADVRVQTNNGGSMITGPKGYQAGTYVRTPPSQFAAKQAAKRITTGIAASVAAALGAKVVASLVVAGGVAWLGYEIFADEHVGAAESVGRGDCLRMGSDCF